jgi:CheY-like chemotaxis protein
MQRFMRIHCPHCHARIKAPLEISGQSRNCPGCSLRFVVQRTAPEDAGPILLFDHLPDSSYVGREEGKLILVADDDHNWNDSLRSVLERRGYRVIQAADGVQAREMVHQERPDLMILDMRMPRLGGLPVMEHLQNHPHAPPIIMITAEDGSKHKAYAENLGAVDFLRKPFPMGKLLESVERGLGLRA